MEMLEWDGPGVAYEAVGHGATTVLFLHGLGASRGCFDEAPRFLDPGLFTLLLPDLPGFGDSDKTEDFDYSMSSLARSMEALLEARGVAEVHVVAHSMGGIVALLLAASKAVRVRSFACAEGNLVPEDAFMSSKVSRLKEHVFERVWTKWTAMVRESLGADSGSRQHDLFVEALKTTTPMVVHRASKDCAALTISGELAERFRRLRCATLFLVGEKTVEERGIPQPVLDTGVPVVTIPGADHFLMEQADAFYPAVVDFLTR